MSPPIIDTHIHLFTTAHLPHLAWATPEDPLYGAHSTPQYALSIPPSQRSNLRGFVFVETDRVHTIPPQEAIANNDTATLQEHWKWTIEEFNFVYDLSLTDDLVLGIVPWAPMNLGVAAMEAYVKLLDLQGRRGRMLKGFRYLVQDKPRGTILEDNFVDAMEWVWRRGWVVEIGVDVRSGGMWQLEEAAEAVERIVKRTEEGVKGTGHFVINHLAKPNLHLPPDTLAHNDDFTNWRTLLTRIASTHPSIAIKLSGAFSELPHDPALYIRSPEDYIRNQIRPWVKHALEAFGPGRVVWGSDWPVCMVGFEKILPDVGKESAWEWWRRVAGEVLRECGVGEKEEIGVWAGNAERVYGLGLGRNVGKL